MLPVSGYSFPNLLISGLGNVNYFVNIPCLQQQIQKKIIFSRMAVSSPLLLPAGGHLLPDSALIRAH